MTDVNGQTNFTQQFAINGQRGVEAVFAMDGADVSDPEMGGSTFHEFRRGRDSGTAIKLRLDAGGHRARRGRLTNIVTRSGRSGFSRFLLRVLKELCSRRAELFRSPVDCGPGRIPPFRRKRVRTYERRPSRVAERV